LAKQEKLTIAHAVILIILVNFIDSKYRRSKWLPVAVVYHAQGHTLPGSA